jgi:uncharacterized membrane protein YeaQ/YmgE (transglycosylase-associated protein family)
VSNSKAVLAVIRRTGVRLSARPVERAKATWLGLPQVYSSTWGSKLMGFIWTIIIGFLAGVIAKFLMPGKNEPSGFILTTLLGVVGAFVATYLGQALGWYRADEGAGLIGAVVGAIIVLAIWGFVARSRSSV